MPFDKKYQGRWGTAKPWDELPFEDEYGGWLKAQLWDVFGTDVWDDDTPKATAGTDPKAELQAEIDKLKEENARLRAENERLRKEIAALSLF